MIGFVIKFKISLPIFAHSSFTPIKACDIILIIDAVMLFASYSPNTEKISATAIAKLALIVLISPVILNIDIKYCLIRPLFF